MIATLERFYELLLVGPVCCLYEMRGFSKSAALSIGLTSLLHNSWL